MKPIIKKSTKQKNRKKQPSMGLMVQWLRLRTLNPPIWVQFPVRPPYPNIAQLVERLTVVVKLILQNQTHKSSGHRFNSDCSELFPTYILCGKYSKKLTRKKIYHSYEIKEL